MLREPLVHFLVLGGLIFGVFDIENRRDGQQVMGNRIYIPLATVHRRISDFRQSSGREPDPQEIQMLIGDCVRQEVLVREARALGFDREDPIVRTRLRQLMEQMAEDRAPVATPTAGELDAFYRAHADDFKTADGRAPPPAAIRGVVLAAWQREQRRTAADAAYQMLRRRYQVEIEKPTGADAKSP